ncbi:MAG: hypothetical protein F4X30_06470, partial [Acidimicrobiaceae bacterium]|nr:hypothetical protein [Acidimicrobiaceae bacterium]
MARAWRSGYATDAARIFDIFFSARFDVDSVPSGLSAAGEFLLTDASERLIRGVFNDVNVDIVVDDAAH